MVEIPLQLWQKLITADANLMRISAVFVLLYLQNTFLDLPIESVENLYSGLERNFFWVIATTADATRRQMACKHEAD